MDLAIKIQQELTSTRIDQWVRNELFKPDWWWLLILFVAAAFIWWKTMDKSRIHEIVLYVAIIVIFVIALDELGEELSFWDYTYDIIPLFPPMTAIDLSCLPLAYSLIFQILRKWKGFLIASVVLALCFCFILEPLFDKIGVYQPLIWKYYYGFPIYILVGVIAKAAVGKIGSRHSMAESIKEGLQG